MAAKELTIELARRLICYDVNTGVFMWPATRRSGVKPNTITGFLGKNGYVHINLLGRTYRAGRLAWFYVTGDWPKNHIDHINGDRSDNRFSNLRDVPEATNHQNQRRAQKGNKSGFLGVFLNKRTNKFIARIMVDGKSRDIGRYKTPEEASSAYISAKRKLHHGCTL